MEATQITKTPRGVFKNQRGISLIEVLLSMVIIATIIGGAISLFGKANDSAQLQTETKNLTAIRGGVKQLYSTSPSYAGLTTAIATNSGIFPETMKRTAGIKNAWDGDVTVVVNTGNAVMFDVTYKAVPKTSCIGLASQDLNNWSSIKVGATAVTSISTASTACSAATNDLTFVSL